MLKQLFEAIRQNDVQLVNQILQTNPQLIGEHNETGTTPLAFAAYNENKQMLELLRKARVTPDFFEAAIVGEIPFVQAALAAGQDINERAPDGFTALSLAVFFRQAETARYLIESGADVNAQATNASQVGPIHAAVAREDIVTLELLLYHGADANACQQKSLRPVHAAASSGNTQLVALLLMFGADPSLANEDGRLAADYARDRGHHDLARRLDILAVTGS
jgi:ankyrin repeat protein